MNGKPWREPTDEAAVQRILQTGAGHPVKRPPGAAASVFDLPRANRLVRPAVLDPNMVPIRDEPLPPRAIAKPVGVYAALYERLKPGQAADLTDEQAKAFARWAGKHGKKVERRRVAPGISGVWRLT